MTRQDWITGLASLLADPFTGLCLLALCVALIGIWITPREIP